MRFKSFVSMGVAAVLIVPTLITAANPELAYAKTTSSKKISAKAKSVIAKIKAINPKKSNYVTKTKSAVNAYKKLSSKDKKMVYNYGTLKKHWTIVQNRKAKQVIASIKAINPKKSDYVLKTKSALSAYNKLSKTDKKKVTNYSTLKKHWKNIQPYLKKVDAFNKSVATLSTANFTTKSVTLEKQYDNLDAITKAAVPSTTLKKLSYYSDVVSTKKLVFKTLGTSTPTTDSTDGTVILNIINAYKKLSGGQQTLLKDLISDNTSAQAKLDKYLALEDIVKAAADIEKQYATLKPTSTTYAQDLVAVFNNYSTVKDNSKVYTDKNNVITTFYVNDFVPHNVEINGIGAAYANEISKAKEFNDYINQFEAGVLTNAYDTIKNKLPAYKVLSITTATLNYPKVAPIDLADKKAVTAYKKYEPVPDVVDGFNFSLPSLNQVTWVGSGEESTKPLLTSTQISKLGDLLPQYNKLGSNQKSIVQSKLTADTNNAKDYLSEGKNLTSAQAIDKSYASAIKNKAKPSYFADLKKVYDSYNAEAPEVKRFVLNATNIINITKAGSDYSKALTDANALQTAIETLNENSKLSTGDPSINAVIGKYKIMSKQIPTPLSLVDASALKTYNQFAAIPDVVKLVNKIPTKAEPTEGNAYGFKTNNINDILSAIKSYKKLGSTQQTIVDKETNHVPSISSLADDESYIKEAQKIDSAYLKLKKSSKTYPKDAKKVKESYDDATEDVIKYLAYKDKIAQLTSAYEKPQKIADDFAALVNPLDKNSTIADVEKAVNYYNDSIAPNTQASDLVDKVVMKKYNEYAPVANVVKLLSLIKESNVDSPSVTPTDVIYIQKATIAYNALKPEPKMIIDDASRAKFPFLYDGKYIKEAAEIDKAFEKVKPTDDKYEKELLDVYYEYYDRAPFVKKYVAHKKELEDIGNIYKEPLAIAKEFEKKVRYLSHISESGYTPTVKTVRNVEQYYFDNIKYNKINAKYNIPLSTLIPDDVMEKYNKYALVLQIQDIAKSIYVLYGKLFNNQNVDFDYEKDEYYCTKDSNTYASNCTRRDAYLNNPEQYKVGYTDTGKRTGNPIKITNPNDVKLIYKAIDYYQQLDAEQRAVLEKAPSALTDTYYKDRYGGNTEPNTEEGDVHLSIPMSDGEIKNFLKAQEIDKEYEALNPSSKTYINDAIALYYKFKKAGKPVQLYTVHEKDIKAFSTKYDTSGMITGIENFEDKVNKLSNKSLLTDIVDDTSHSGVVDQYNKLNEAQLAVIDQGVLTKYNAYSPIAEIMSLTPAIPASGKTYSDVDINNMLKAISIYKKLTKDPKAIINVKNDPYKYLLQEADIKAAQKVDNAFKKLDKTDDKYVANLKKVKKDYDSLSDTAQKYVTSAKKIEEAVGKAIYTTPNDKAKAFEELIIGKEQANGTFTPTPWLDLESVPYSRIDEAVTSYNALSTKAKSLVDSDVMKIYNKYAPIESIVKTLAGITPVVISSTSPTEADSIGYYKNYYKNQDPTKDVGSEILNAIQLYNKLGSDQKEIVLKTVSSPDSAVLPEYPLTQNQLALLKETNNIKAAQALDKKIEAIKPSTASYVKGVIDANKTLEVMPKEQRVYLLNAKTLTDYETKTQTKKAINDLTKFELGVKQVDQWTSEMEKDSNGNITGTCTDNSTNPASTITCSSDLITKQMNDLKTQFDQLNIPRLVDGSEIKLASLIDRTILARYQYFRAIYDVIDELKK